MRIPPLLLAAGMGSRSLTYFDFEKICDQEGILVARHDIPCEGYYACVDGIPCIALNRRLKEPRLSVVAFHELGHHYLHEPAFYRYGDPASRKAEWQAQQFAVIALIPWKSANREFWPPIFKLY